MQQDDRLSRTHPVMRNSKSLRRRCENVAAGLFTTLIVLEA
jgi:hypothetical protein